MQLSRVLRRYLPGVLVAATCLLILTNPPVTDWVTNIMPLQQYSVSGTATVGWSALLVRLGRLGL